MLVLLKVVLPVNMTFLKLILWNMQLTINEQIQNIAQKKDTLCRRMYN